MAADIKERIEKANAKALEILTGAQPTWVDVMLAGEFMPKLGANMILHSGPPIEPARASTPFRNSVCGAAIHEGLARTTDDAWKMVLAKEIVLEPLFDHRSAGGAAFMVTRHTPLQIAEDKTSGSRAACVFQEGMSPEAFRWGLYTPAIAKNLRWIEDTLAPALRDMVRAVGGINIRNILARAEGMGDENHSRQQASSLLLMQQMVPAVMDLSLSEPKRKEVIKFLCTAERFFLHVFIAGAAAVLEAVKNIDACTVVVAVGGNGTDCGIKVSATGDRWYTAPAAPSRGMLINPSYTEADKGLYLGDSSIVECYGFGGASAAAGPMVSRLYGGGLEDALKRTEEYRRLTLGTQDWAPIPWLNFQGPPVGIDIRKVVSTGISPTLHGGIAHKNGGQAGAGAMTVPMSVFVDALKAVAAKYGL